tara:strand:- start:457 stop:669 length:213 start_codon:yes stop_codon:yes gene_type:complete
MEFEVKHSMSFEDQACLGCDSKNVFRRPHLQDSIRIDKNVTKVGKIVEDYIVETKKEIKKEKNKLKREVK